MSRRRQGWKPLDSLNFTADLPLDVPESAPPLSPTDPTVATELIKATALLQALARNPDLLSGLTADQRAQLVTAAGDVFCPDLDQRRQQAKLKARFRKRDRDRSEQSVLAASAIRTLRSQAVYITPNVFAPQEPPADDADANNDTGDHYRPVDAKQHCYVCKQKYSKIHGFYDQLCPSCAEFNFAKRSELADLQGRVALLTGGRVKIGYQAGIKLLRSGAHLIVTTRFARDCAQRYAQEPDFANWGHKLEIFGLDLRHTPSVEAFCQHLLSTRKRLDFIVNNACQTVRRPPEFYAHMMHAETTSLRNLSPDVQQLVGAYEGLRGYHMLPSSKTSRALPMPLAGLSTPAELSQVHLLPEDSMPSRHLFPDGQLDQDLQQVDLRERNSWRLTLAEVSSVELLETQLVNAIAPFVLNARLKSLMLRTPERDKHIVNVSAVEGQFYRRLKTTRHPHTNMAKAALNMMTRTSAADYHADGIHMNSVDTGWINDEDPAYLAARKVAEHDFHPPLDIVDGAARIVDPIVDGINSGRHQWGKFLKDYREVDW